MSLPVAAKKSPPKNSHKRNRLFSNSLVYILLVFGAMVMVLPFVWMVLTSFKTYMETIAIPIKWFPAEWNFNNYHDILVNYDFIRYYINTISMTVFSVAGQLLLCSIAAYAFARMRFPGRNAMFFMLLTVFMVPSQMTIIPKYLILAKLNWLNTLHGLVIPSWFSVFTVFLLRQFFAALPTELEDAGKIDGCSHFRLYWRIMLPLTKNALITVGVLNVLSVWNELMWPLIVTSSEKMRVLSVAMAVLQGHNSSGRTHILMAGGVLATLPTLLIYIVGQKYITSGITMTGIKG